MYKATVQVTLRPSILDPQGKAVHQALGSLGFDGVSSVRMGKLAELMVDAPSEEAAEALVREACEKLIANPVMEDFAITIESVAQEPA
ncbi:MAG: phosphoribosylformylglycinamidine synthase subunit PurS [Bacteroidota bacterium]